VRARPGAIPAAACSRYQTLILFAVNSRERRASRVYNVMGQLATFRPGPLACGSGHAATSMDPASADRL
jgi:hypothetical protein